MLALRSFDRMLSRDIGMNSGDRLLAQHIRRWLEDNPDEQPTA